MLIKAMNQESLRQILYNLAVSYLRYKGIEVSAETLRRLLKDDPVQ